MEKERSSRDKILEAALTEFGTLGYSAASTNTICQEAKVSKGMIFKIFGSKGNLYGELFKTCMQGIIDGLKNSQIMDLRDPIERMAAIAAWKMKYASDHPFQTKVLLDDFMSPPKEVQVFLGEHLTELSVLSTRSFFHDISMENISEKYSKEDVISNLEIGVIGLQQKFINQKFTMEDMISFKDTSLEFLNTILKGMEK